MKKLISAALMFAGISIINISTKAQGNESRPSLRNLSVSNSGTGESKMVAPASKAESRAFKDFSRNYKNAANVSWLYSGDIIMARFSDNSVTKRVMYTGNGHWLRTLISYDESQLSDYVKSKVKQGYPKFKITTVTEVHEPNIIAYFINIENDRTIKTVIAYEDQVWTHKQYKKS